MSTKYTLNEILYIVKEDFNKDFDCADVRSGLRDILTDDEFERIAEVQNKIERIDRLFFILIYGNKNVNEFLNVIQIEYEWLYEKVMQTYNDSNYQNSMINECRNCVRNLRTEIPRHLDFNIHRDHYLWSIRQELLNLNRSEYLIVHGNLGIGKRWLTLDACCNFCVIRQMNYKIFWLNVSKCKTPRENYLKLQRLLIHLGYEKFDDVNNSNFEEYGNKIASLKQKLRKILEQDSLKDCLIVLADVQNTYTIKTFDLYCKILLTTRNKQVIDALPSQSRHSIQISQGFTNEENLRLYQKIFNEDNNSNHKRFNVNELPMEARELNGFCKGYPLLMSLITYNMKDYYTSRHRWIKWKNILKEYQSTNFDEEFRNTIIQPLSDLSDDEKQLYRSLVIFGDNVNIPIKVLQLYWNKNEKSCEKIVKLFDRLYLIEMQVIKSDTIICSLQYHYYSYLKTSTTEIERKQMHSDLVNAYRIPLAFEFRTEPKLLYLHDDDYFHFYIGYHLKCAEKFELFSQLYLDFGFLEQKLRATGLPNTLGDLLMYKKEIIDQNEYRKLLLKEILHYLPNVEEMIFKSRDTCLLQYAINADGVIKTEAMRQASQFRNRVWFSDKDHSNKRRQMIQLHAKPYLVRFSEPNTALVALMDHNILLTDLSLCYTVEPTLYTGHTATIVNILIFWKNYFVSLDINGICKVWSMADTPISKRRQYSKRHHHQKNDKNKWNNGGSSFDENGIYGTARQYRTESYDVINITNKNCLQSFSNTNGTTNGIGVGIGIGSGKDYDKFRCIYLLDTVDRDLVLYTSTEKGEIFTYQWNEYHLKFEQINYHRFSTRLPNISNLMFIPNIFLMTLNNSGTLRFYNLKDHSAVALTSEWKPFKTPINVHRYTGRKQYHYALVVFAEKIIRISFKSNNFENCLMTEFDEIYTITDEQTITCSQITDDEKYLVLGTKRGIILFDLVDQLDILRSNVSDYIISIDVYSLDNSVYKYIIIAATKYSGPILTIYGIEMNNNGILWASDRMGSPINEENLYGRNNLNTWLLGGKLFDVLINEPSSSVDVNNQNFNHNPTDAINDYLDNITIVAINSENQIYQQNRNLLSFSTNLQLAGEDDVRITTLSAFKSTCFIGCENGFVYKLNQEQPFFIFKSPVEYLQCHGMDLILAGTNDSFNIRHLDNVYRFPSRKIIKSFLFKTNFIVIVKDDCSFDILDINKMSILITKNTEDANVTTSCCELMDDCLMISTKSTVYIYGIKLTETNEENPDVPIEIKLHCKMNTIISDQITSLAISTDNTLLAIAYKNGLIILLKIPSLELVRKLQSHKTSVTFMKFSETHQKNTKIPTILVSCGEEMCYWDITYIINNPMDNNHQSSNCSSFDNTSTIRRSQRFGKQLSITSINHSSSTTTVLKSSSSASSTSSSTVETLESSSSTEEIIQLTDNNNNNNNETLQHSRYRYLGHRHKKERINPWIGKCGPSDKPELLSCIKFIGRLAEKVIINKNFTKFITIDDEGDIYILDILSIIDKEKHRDGEEIGYRTEATNKQEQQLNEQINQQQQEQQEEDQSHVYENGTIITYI